MWSNQNSLNGTVMWYNHLQKQPGHFLKLNIYQCIHIAPRYVSQRNESKCPHKGSYTYVHCRFMHNNQKSKTTQMKNQNVVCLHMEYYSAIFKRDKLLIHAITRMSLRIWCWGQFPSWSGGIVIKFMCSAVAAWGSWVRIPGMDLHSAHQAMLWRRPIYKIEEDWHRC